MLLSGNNTWRDADAGSFGIYEPISSEGVAPARRLNPPTTIVPLGLHDLPLAPEGLSNCAEMNFYRIQFGLPSIFDDYHVGTNRSKWHYGWRESNCRNEESVHTSCCWGYWQQHQDHFHAGNIFDIKCGVKSRFDIDSDNPYDKQRQACSARALYDRDGLSPWQ